VFQDVQTPLPLDGSDRPTAKPYAVGIDVGGTKIAAGALDRSMNVLSTYVTKEHSGQLPALVVDAIERAYWESLKRADISPDQVAGVGVSFCGHTDGRRGVALTTSNMPEWSQVPLRDILSKRINQHVLLDNDTNMAVIAEHRYGAGRGATDLVYVTCSTGIGMGIVLGGKLYQGHLGTAGELGHTVVEVDGRRCTCGKRGCLMAYAGGIALFHRAIDRINAGEETVLRELCWDDPQLINGEMICEAARQGDPMAQDLIISSGRYLGIGLADVVQVLNPEKIVLGGGLINIGSMLLDPCLESLRENIPQVPWGPGRVVLGRFQQNVSLIGGAAAVFAEIDAEEPENAFDYTPIVLGQSAPAQAADPLSTEERLMLEQVEGTVNAIQVRPLGDGSGSCTAVFLKGCPLRCSWCSNPKSQRVKPELLMFATRCTSCGACADICGAHSRLLDEDQLIQWDRKACTRCGDCVKVCPAQATVWTGDRKTAGEVVREVALEKGLPGASGMTLAGGEPLLQPSFAAALLRLAKADNMDTTLETSGNAPWETFEAVAPYVDLWIFELKHVESQAHHEWTGVGNELILSNLRRLAASGARVRVRVPLIPGVNSDDESLRGLAGFITQLEGRILSLDLVPIGKRSRVNYDALGSGSRYSDFPPLSDDEVRAAAALLGTFNFNVRFPGDGTGFEALEVRAAGCSFRVEQGNLARS